MLDLAGLFFPLFYISTEAEAQVEIIDRDTIIRGKIDVLALKEQLWILVIESKWAELSLKAGIPQALAYMLATPLSQRSLYGMVTNGSNFVFLKLERQEFPYYGRSRKFVLENSGDLGTILQVMKRLATLVGVE
ncbi:MAG: hypothetical protein NW224_11490 [Leptolyngbyaceae cyanobacterium bins.302]|nr:hypothetical protein [Leptolyngbyaceae cyanobacterium bins.302]